MSRRLALISSLTLLLISMLAITIRVQRVKASETIYIKEDFTQRDTFY